MLQSKTFTLVKEKFKYTELRWAKFFVIPGLAAFTLLLILSNVKQPGYYKADIDIQVNKVREAPEQPLKCTRHNCQIFCSNGEVHLLAESLTKLITDCKEIEIDFLRCQLPEGKLRKDWINGTFRITSLRFILCELNEIEIGAFDNPVLSNATSVELNSVQLQTLNKDTFKGLNTLQNLVVISTRTDFAPKKDFLKNINSYLLRLGISVYKGPKAENPKNLLGAEELSSVEEVDLSDNNFGDLIDKDSFAVLLGVKKLYLKRCNITALRSDTFDSVAKTVNLVDLRWNAMKSLSENFFNWLEPSALVTILLTNNPWDCSCSLWSFMEFYKQNPKYFETNITCNTPQHFAGLNIKDPNLCAASTTEITMDRQASSTVINEAISTDQSIPVPSKEPLTDVLRLQCDKNKNEDYLEMKPANIKFFVLSISSTGVKITITKFRGEYSIVWFDKASKNYKLMEINYKEYGLGCNARISREIIIENLKPRTSYVFCLIKVGHVEISPFNCHSHYMSDGSVVTSAEDWLLWGSKAATCSLIPIGVLLSVSIGAIFTIFILKRNPTLLKSSKRVIVVKRHLDEIVLPRSSSTSSNSRNNTTRSSQSSRPISLLRSISESSIVSGRSYVYVIPSNIYEVVQYQQRSDVKVEKFYFDDGIPPNSPPPVPKRSSTISTILPDDLYSSCKRY